MFSPVTLRGLLDLHYFLGMSPGALGHAGVLGAPLLLSSLGSVLTLGPQGAIAPASGQMASGFHGHTR